MPIGIYERTEKHKKICSMAGRASAKSPINKSRYAARRVLVKCPCGNSFTFPVSQKRRFCNIVCKKKYFRLPDNKITKYTTAHGRVREKYGTPQKCEHCKTEDSPKFEWACLSQDWTNLVRDNWMRLCCQCHRRFDFGTKNKIEVRV